MKFYRPDEVPARPDDLVCKAAALGPFIWVVIFYGGAISLVWFGIFGAKHYGPGLVPKFFIFAAAVAFALFGRISWGMFRACLKPTNWLLRCGDNGVFIKYRSFLNWRFPADDVQVVGFDYSELAEVRKVKESRITPSMGPEHNRQYQRVGYLEFCLADTDTSALEEHLLTEQNVVPPGSIKTTVLDYPVAVLPGGVIRLRWSASGSFRLAPSLNQTIDHLSRHVKSADAVSTKTDLTYHRNLSPEEGDARIRELVKSGDKMGAVELAQQVHRFGLSEAVAFVEKIQAGG